MDIATAARLAIIPMIIISSWVYLRHIQDDMQPLSRLSRFNYILSGGFAVVAMVSSIPRPTTLWLRIICVISTYQALLIYFYNIKQVTEGRIIYFYKQPLYIITVIISAIVITLDVFGRDNLTWFVNDEPYVPTPVYYASHITFYSVGIYLGILGFVQEIRFAKRDVADIVKLRNSIGIFIFFLVWVSAILVEFNLLLSFFYGDMYRHSINQIYHAIKLIFGIMILFASIPSSVMEYAVSPIRYLTRYQQRRDQALIAYLHARMTRIVPIVRLPLLGDEHHIRQLIEAWS
jgi:hypothetical protein